MSFSHSNGIITQTGTDTNLSGLSGLTGVTTYANVYVLDNVFIRVEGTLSFNGYEERLVFVNPDDSGIGLDYMSIYVDDGASLTISCDNGVKTVGFVETNTLATCIDFGTRAIHGPNGATIYNQGRKFFCVHPNGFIALTGVFIGENSNTNGIISSFDGTSELVDCLLITKTSLANVQYSFKGTALIRRTTFLGAVLADRGATYTFDGFQVGEANEGFLFGGGAIGNAHTTVVDFATYNTRNQDIRFNMNPNTSYGTVILVDAQKDPNNTVVLMLDNDGFNFCVWQSNLTLNFVDTDFSPIDVKVFAQDVDNGNRFGTVVVSGGTDISDSTKTYQGTTSSGSISFAPYSAFSSKISGVYTVDNRGNSNGPNITFKFYSYGLLAGNVIPTLVGNGVKIVTSTALPDPNITTTKLIADSYTELDTANKLYDKAASYLEDNHGTYTDFIVDRSGNLIDCRALNVNIDATASQAFNLSGNTLTIKSSNFTDDMETTGIITLLNGATFSGTRTDANGTVLVPRNVSISGITSGSRLKILNITTGITTFNGLVNATTYTEQYQEGNNYSQGNQLEITLTYQIGTTAKIPLISQAIVGATGWSLLVNQKDLTAYSSLGADGSTVTEYNIDSNTGNLEIDANDTDCFSSKRRLVARYYYLITTEEGINRYVNAIILEDEANAIIDRTITNLKLDNTGSCTLNLTDSDFRLYTSDNSSWIKNPPTGGFGIISDSGKVYVNGQEELKNKVDNLIDREDADIYVSPTSYIKKKKGTDIIIVTKNYTTDGQGNETLTETT